MPLFEQPDNVFSATLAELAAPLNKFFETPPVLRGPDFANGFIITALPPPGAGTPPAIPLALLGTQMPQQPFEWGGTQRIVKEYYPGNPEPTIQVLGPEESDITLRGRFKAKRYKTEDQRAVPMALQEEFDNMRKRGVLCKFELGEWVRYGFIQQASFKMRTLADLDWEVTLVIIGDEPPTDCKWVAPGPQIPNADNMALIKASALMEAKLGLAPVMPQSLFGLVSSLISTVATAIAMVTTFVDIVVSAAENVQALVNKAVGLIQYAKAQIARFKRRLSQLGLYSGTDVPGGVEVPNETLKINQAKFLLEIKSITAIPPDAQLSPLMQELVASKYAMYTPNTVTQEKAASIAGGKSIDQSLASMLAVFQAMAATIPMSRHLVQQGDTLQKLAVKYYQDANKWKAIYDHNKLQTTELAPASFLEIPRA